MIKISVIIPVFNGEFYIKEALDSIINQTMFEEIEVIMVDDGSTDNSRHIIDQYALNYENFFAYHMENKGVTFARNFGIELANGEYIHLMDADDYLDCEAYEKLYNLASKYNHDVVMGNFLRFNSRRTWDTDIPDFVFSNVNQPIENTTLEKNNNLTWDMFIWNKLYKREFLNENNIRFPYKNLTFQDNLFSIEVYARAKSIGMLEDYIYFWRARETNPSITQVINIKWATDRFEILNMVHDFINKNISNNDVLYKKYLKWLKLDLPNLIIRVKQFPKEEHIFLFENIYNIVNLVPNEFFKKLSSYDMVLFSMVKNKDWDNLIKFISYDLKNNPNINMDIDNDYIAHLNLSKDSEDEKFNVNTTSISINEDFIKIKFNYSIPYIDLAEAHSCKCFLVNEDNQIFISKISNNEINIPIEIFDFNDYKIKMVYESKSFKKESFMKTISRNLFNLGNIYFNIYFDKYGFIHINKSIPDNNQIVFKSLTFDGEKFTLIGESENILEKACLNDILSFKHFEYPIHYKNNNFKLNICYNDLLNAPVKKWELYNMDSSLVFKLSKSYQFYTEDYVINIKNYGNKILIELNLYDKLKKINELYNKNEKLTSENKNLKKIVSENSKNNVRKHKQKNFSSQIYTNQNVLKSKGLINQSNLDKIKVIRKLNLFDDDFYLNSYPEVRFENIDPLTHYLTKGFKEGKNPSPTFDTRFYLDMYDDVRQSKTNPLVHYALIGIEENRIPSPFADCLIENSIIIKKFLTKEIFENIESTDDSYKNKWNYFNKVIEIINNLENVYRILEVGPYKAPLCKCSDILDATDKYVKFYPLSINHFYKQSYFNVPYPIENKKYDLVIICQVTKHIELILHRNEIFEEIKRISNSLLITLPKNIDRNKIDFWTNNLKPSSEYLFDDDMIFVYDF